MPLAYLSYFQIGEFMSRCSLALCSTFTFIAALTSISISTLVSVLLHCLVVISISATLTTSL